MQLWFQYKLGKEKTYQHKIKMYIRLNGLKDSTCFSDTGKVSFPQISGLLTISLHMVLQERQTEAHATTCFREGHVLSLSSSLLITSYNSSGGRLAQRLFWTMRGWSCKSFNDPWDFPLWWPISLTSKPRLDKLPKPSLTSRTILRNDILVVKKSTKKFVLSSLKSSDFHLACAYGWPQTKSDTMSIATKKILNGEQDIRWYRRGNKKLKEK